MYKLIATALLLAALGLPLAGCGGAEEAQQETPEETNAEETNAEETSAVETTTTQKADLRRPDLSRDKTECQLQQAEADLGEAGAAQLVEEWKPEWVGEPGKSGSYITPTLPEHLAERGYEC